MSESSVILLQSFFPLFRDRFDKMTKINSNYLDFLLKTVYNMSTGKKNNTDKQIKRI